MAKKKKLVIYSPIYHGQSARFRTFRPMADMTVEELNQLQWELTTEFQLREGWRNLATSRDAAGGDER
jgi:hypothetical protein